MKDKKDKTIKQQFDQLLAFDSEKEQLEHEAQILAFQFLAKVDRIIAERNISKKDLAQQVGTSASFITQLFRGDRKPNWTILAKMQKELGLEFKVVTQKEINHLLGRNIIDYHRKWIKSREYENRKGLTALPDVIMSIEENKYQPLAG